MEIGTGVEQYWDNPSLPWSEPQMRRGFPGGACIIKLTYGSVGRSLVLLLPESVRLLVRNQKNSRWPQKCQLLPLQLIFLLLCCCDQNPKDIIWKVDLTSHHERTRKPRMSLDFYSINIGLATIEQLAWCIFESLLLKVQVIKQTQ